MVIHYPARQSRPHDTYKVVYFDREWAEIEHLSFTGAGYLSAFAAVQAWVDYRVRFVECRAPVEHVLAEVHCMSLEVEIV